MAADAKSPNPAQPGRGGAEIPIHPLVTKLLGESGEPQNLVTMVGYIGPSKKEAHVRLYTGLDFQTYYEVPRESVALAEAVDREDENSPTRVMIPADATVELVQTSKQTGPASYLAGAAAAQAPIGIPFPTRRTLLGPCEFITQIPTQCYCTQHCPVFTFFCTIDCGGPDTSAGCPQPDVQIGGPAAAQAQPAWLIPLSVLCPSVGVPCPSRGLYCPTHLCPITQPPRAEAAAAQAAMGPLIGGWSIGCPSIYLACGTHIHCGGTPRCPMVQPAAPQVVTNPFCPTATHCTMVRPCTVHHGCPTAGVVC